MNINTRRGFALLEAVISVAILAILLTPMLVMQNTVINRVIKDKGFAARIQTVENIFYFQAMNPDGEKQKSFDKEYQDPDFKVNFEQKDLQEGSELKRFKNMDRIEVTGAWTVWSGQQELKAFQLFFDPESEQEDEA